LQGIFLCMHNKYLYLHIDLKLNSIKIFLTIFGICAFLGTSNAQEKATDMFSINAGVLGAELGYEKRL
jgi:hypothetical protein